MAENILLITAYKIKDQTIIEQNIDDNVLAAVTWNVQETQLKPVLGKDNYDFILNEVSQQIDDSGYVIADVWQNMLSDYIKPFLLTAITAEFIITNNYKVTNKGLMKLTDNSANAASIQEAESLKNIYDNKLSTYKKNLICYLKDNKLIPEFNSKTDTNTTASTIGWYLVDDCRYNYKLLNGRY